MVVVAALAAQRGGVPSGVTITATRRRTRSAASAGSRSKSSSAQRYSIATFRPRHSRPRSSLGGTRPGCRGSVRPTAGQNTDHRHLPLLRPRRQRPRRRAPQQAYELAPPHLAPRDRRDRIGLSSLKLARAGWVVREVLHTPGWPLARAPVKPWPSLALPHLPSLQSLSLLAPPSLPQPAITRWLSRAPRSRTCRRCSREPVGHAR